MLVWLLTLGVWFGLAFHSHCTASVPYLARFVFGSTNARDDQPEAEPEEPEQSADPEPPKPQLKASIIVVRLQDCEEWLEKQSDADPLQLIHLRNLRSFAQRKTQKSLKD